MFKINLTKYGIFKAKLFNYTAKGVIILNMKNVKLKLDKPAKKGAVIVLSDFCDYRKNGYYKCLKNNDDGTQDFQRLYLDDLNKIKRPFMVINAKTAKAQKFQLETPSIGMPEHFFYNCRYDTIGL